MEKVPDHIVADLTRKAFEDALHAIIRVCTLIKHPEAVNSIFFSAATSIMLYPYMAKLETPADVLPVREKLQKEIMTVFDRAVLAKLDPNFERNHRVGNIATVSLGTIGGSNG